MASLLNQSPCICRDDHFSFVNSVTCLAPAATSAYPDYAATRVARRVLLDGCGPAVGNNTSAGVRGWGVCETEQRHPPDSTERLEQWGYPADAVPDSGGNVTAKYPHDIILMMSDSVR